MEENGGSEAQTLTNNESVENKVVEKQFTEEIAPNIENELNEKNEAQENEVEEEDDSVKISVHLPPNFTRENLVKLLEPFGDKILYSEFDVEKPDIALVTVSNLFEAKKVIESFKENKEHSPDGFKAELQFKETETHTNEKGEEIERMYVGSLPTNYTEDDLRAIFSSFGEIKGIHILVTETGASKGCAFIQFDSKESTDKAIEQMSNKLLEKDGVGFKVQVRVARPRKYQGAPRGGFFNRFNGRNPNYFPHRNGRGGHNNHSDSFESDRRRHEEGGRGRGGWGNGRGGRGGDFYRNDDRRMNNFRPPAHIPPMRPPPMQPMAPYSMQMSMQRQFYPSPNQYPTPSQYPAQPVLPPSYQHQPYPVQPPAPYPYATQYAYDPSTYPYYPTQAAAPAYGMVNYSQPAVPVVGGTAPVETEARKARGDGPVGANLFVCQLPTHFREPDLSNLFSSYGEVMSTKVVMDRVSGESKGYGFVSYHVPAHADAASQALNGFQVGNKRIKVSFREPKPAMGTARPY